MDPNTIIEDLKRDKQFLMGVIRELQEEKRELLSMVIRLGGKVRAEKSKCKTGDDLDTIVGMSPEEFKEELRKNNRRFTLWAYRRLPLPLKKVYAEFKRQRMAEYAGLFETIRKWRDVDRDEWPDDIKRNFDGTIDELAKKGLARRVAGKVILCDEPGFYSKSRGSLALTESKEDF